MHSNRPSNQKETALRQLALAHSGLFLPAETETVKDGVGELANDIKTDLQILLRHIAYGEQAEAEKIIDAAPHFLRLSGSVVNYSLQNIIDVTPAQLAFGGDDEEMCAMLKDKLCAYYDKLHHDRELGEAEFIRQIDEKFPDHHQAENMALAELENILRRVVAAIDDPDANIANELHHVPNESPLRKILDEFREKYAPGAVKNGRHFPVEFYLTAVRFFERHMGSYNIENLEKFILFGTQIRGYLERLLPVSYAQACCQGIDGVVHGEPLQRRLAFRFGGSYYPLDAEPSHRLGYSDGVFVCSSGAELVSCGGDSQCLDMLEKLISMKRGKLDSLRKPYQERASLCVMC